MDLLIRLILLLISLVFALFIGVESDVAQPEPTGDTMRVPIMIDDVQVQLLESLPVQVQLQVQGTIQDGCQFPVITESGPDGNTVTVDIYREVPMDVMCPMNIQVYEDTIDLGTFEPGSYTVNVNGTIVEFDV